MHQEKLHLVDIRRSPRSRWWPAWNQSKLIERYGERYTWEPRLGNLHYQQPERGILLAAGYQEAVQDLAAQLAEGTSLLLLCACKHERTCHRTLVAKLLQDAVLALIEEAVS